MPHLAKRKSNYSEPSVDTCSDSLNLNSLIKREKFVYITSVLFQLQQVEETNSVSGTSKNLLMKLYFGQGLLFPPTLLAFASKSIIFRLAFSPAKL